MIYHFLVSDELDIIYEVQPWEFVYDASMKGILLMYRILRFQELSRQSLDKPLAIREQ